MHLLSFVGNCDVALISVLQAILCGSVYHIADQGVNSTVKWGVNENFLMFFGTSVYAFEGIAMVLPIEADMEDPGSYIFLHI